MFQDNSDAAGAWLLDEGMKYSKDPELRDEASGGHSEDEIRLKAVTAV